MSEDLELPPEQQESNSEEGKSLAEAISTLTGDVLINSGLPLDAKWTKMSFNRRFENKDDEYLGIDNFGGGSYLIYYSPREDRYPYDSNGHQGPAYSISGNGEHLHGPHDGVSPKVLTDAVSSFKGQEARLEFIVPAQISS